MPTGYTSKISEGISFEDFVMQCARAFGACITMRDEPWDAKIPDEFKPSDYHSNALKDLKAELAEMYAMSLSEAEDRATQRYLNDCGEREKSIQKHKDLRAKYESMLRKVNAWRPPTPEHVQLKEFMQEQITESIDFDCMESYYRDKEIEQQSGQQWKDDRIAFIRRNIAYHEKEHADEVDRCAKRSKWVQELRDSLRS